MSINTIKNLSKLLLLIILQSTIIAGDKGFEYYWRNYDGENIPNDALEMEEGSNTYIGQVYIYPHGIFIGTLNKGENFMEISAYGDEKPIDNIKILCTANPPESNWLNTTTDTFQADIIEQYPIIGGWDSVGHGYINIGRVRHGSSLVAGSVNSFNNDDVHLFYAYEGQEFKVSEFQVLVSTPR